MTVFDEVRELDRQISGQLQQEALAAEVARARAESNASAAPSKRRNGKPRRGKPNERAVTTHYSPVGTRRESAPKSGQLLQPSRDAVEFMDRAFAIPAFRGLMQDLAAYDK